MKSFDWKPTAWMALLCVSCGGSGEGAGGQGGGLDEGAGGAGGAPGCTQEFPPLPEDEIVQLAEDDWPGPLLLSYAGDPDVGYVSLDEGGTARWMYFSTDYYDIGTAVWTIDGSTVVLTGNSDGPTWPNTYATDVTSVTLERVDERTLVAHLTGPAESRDETWVPGGLCNDSCVIAPAYPCDYDFELSWSLAAPDD